MNMNKLLLTLLLGLCLVPGPAEAKEEEDLYSQISRAVIRLERTVRAPKKGSPGEFEKKLVSHGTAFFVSRENTLFVVSARHIADWPGDLSARVEWLNEETGEREIVLLRLPKSRWVFHSNEGDEDTHPVDVAAMRIPWIQDRGVTFFRYDLPGSENEDETQLPMADPSPPRAILVFGFPMHIGFEMLRQRPFVRSGIIGMRTGKKFLRLDNGVTLKFVEERCVLIDAEVFGGNSGSPMTNQTSLHDPKFQLLGLVIGTDKALNYSIVEPVSRIREVLEQAKNHDPEDFVFWSPLQNQEKEFLGSERD